MRLQNTNSGAAKWFIYQFGNLSTQLETLLGKHKISFFENHSINSLNTSKTINKVAKLSVILFVLANIPLVKTDSFTGCINDCNRNIHCDIPNLLCILACVIRYKA